MKRSVVSEYLILAYRQEDTTKDDTIWLSTGEIEHACQLSNGGARGTLTKLEGFGLVKKRIAKHKVVNEEGKKVSYRRMEWCLAVSWEAFLLSYFKYLARGRSNTRNGKAE